MKEETEEIKLGLHGNNQPETPELPRTKLPRRKGRDVKPEVGDELDVGKVRAMNEEEIMSQHFNAKKAGDQSTKAPSRKRDARVKVKLQRVQRRK